MEERLRLTLPMPEAMNWVGEAEPQAGDESTLQMIIALTRRANGMLACLLVLVLPAFAQVPVSASRTLGPILHETSAALPLQTILEVDVPGFVESISLDAELIPNFHMVWTNPSPWPRTVRLVLDYDVWSDRQPDIPDQYNTGSVVDAVFPPPPLTRLGSLLRQESQWFIVPAWTQQYMWLDTPTIGSGTWAAPIGSDNATIKLGNPDGLPVWIEEQNAGQVEDGEFLWVYTDIVVGAAPCLGCAPAGTFAQFGYTWIPALLDQSTLCTRYGNARIGGNINQVWALAWNVDAGVQENSLAMWVESSTPTFEASPSAFCAPGPWRRCYETLTFVGPGTGNATTLPIDTNAVPGDVKYFQLWYRDARGGFLTSDCVRVAF